jgi:ABC-type Fe3+-citrate transport system substrate-binding protein
MAPKSIIIGSIDGISKEDYADLKSELQECFDNISWKDSQLIIKSEKRHTNLKTVIHKIAETITEQKFGALMYVGNETVACIYVGSKQVTTKKFIEPTPPTWWGGAHPVNTK